MDEVVAQKIQSFFTQYRRQTYKKGEIIIRADESPSGIYYLTNGTVKKYAISRNGEEIVVNLFKPISFFPMSWAMNNTPNSYFYEAMTNVELWKAPKDDVITFIKHEPDVLYDLMRRVYRGTDGMLMRMVYLMSGSAYNRLITELLIYAKRFGVKVKDSRDIVCSISENDLAAQAGMTRETVSREMKILKQQELVSVGNGKLIIHDIAKLEGVLADNFNGLPS